MPIARLAEERQKRNKYLKQKVHETLALAPPDQPGLLKVNWFLKTHLQKAMLHIPIHFVSSINKHNHECTDPRSKHNSEEKKYLLHSIWYG